MLAVSLFKSINHA
uniref:Uncharacterized protein n=1 Tax=Arundo donax TaxID=35708 RepID=A0A0A8Y8A4_ARUDO